MYTVRDNKTGKILGKYKTLEEAEKIHGKTYPVDKDKDYMMWFGKQTTDPIVITNTGESYIERNNQQQTPTEGTEVEANPTYNLSLDFNPDGTKRSALAKSIGGYDMYTGNPNYYHGNFTNDFLKSLGYAGVAGGTVALPFLSPTIAGALTLYGGYDGAKNWVQDWHPIETFNKVQNGDYWGAVKDIGKVGWDVLEAAPFVGRVMQGAKQLTNKGVGIGMNYMINRYSPNYTSSYNWRTGKFNLSPRATEGANPISQNNFTDALASEFRPKLLLTNISRRETPINILQSSGKTFVPEYKLRRDLNVQIKSLLKGSPLEKQLSKNGTLSLKQLQAYINRNDVSAIDKELLGRVLQNHVNDTHIDYNTLRQEVQNMIPKYTIVPQTEYSDYGMERINIEAPKEADTEWLVQNDPDISKLFTYRNGEFYDFNNNLVRQFDVRRAIDDKYYDIPIPIVGRNKVNTFTFESPGIKGNTRHYQGDPIGHSRTYTTAEEPDILHVMESQSDWAQHSKEFRIRQNRINEIVNNFKNAQLNQNTLGFSENRFNELYTEVLDDLFNSNIQSRMINTYPIRQLQENLQYAAKSGQHKMRYPTPETAAKIEGYTKSKLTQEYRDALDRLSHLLKNRSSSIPDEIDLNTNTKVYYTPEQRKQAIQDVENIIADLEITQKDRTYPSEHLTILKKYADFPKQFQKLFGKKAEVRTITDSKGNTWYEVDVPQSYFNGSAEIVFKKGGVIERFKNRKNLFKKYTKNK